MTTMNTTITTIKVPKYLRDYLKRSAKKYDNTMAEYLESILRRDERENRIAKLRAEIRKNPPGRAYFAEADRWDAIAEETLDEY